MMMSTDRHGFSPPGIDTQAIESDVEVFNVWLFDLHYNFGKASDRVIQGPSEDSKEFDLVGKMQKLMRLKNMKELTRKRWEEREFPEGKVEEKNKKKTFVNHLLGSALRWV